MEVISPWLAVLGAHAAAGESSSWSRSGVIAEGLTGAAAAAAAAARQAGGGSRLQEKLSCFNMESDDWLLMQRFAQPLAASAGELWRPLWLEEGTAAVWAGPRSPTKTRVAEVSRLCVRSLYIAVNTTLKARCFFSLRIPRSQSEVGSSSLWVFPLAALDLSTADKPSCSSFISFTLFKVSPIQGKGLQRTGPCQALSEIDTNLDLSR